MPRKQKKARVPYLHTTAIIMVLSSLLMVSISTKTLNDFPARAFRAVGSSVQEIFYKVGSFFSNTILSIQKLKNLQNQYNSLAEKLESYYQMERDFADTKAENERLKEQLGFYQTINTVKTSAQIVASEPGNLYETYTINKGSSDGVQRNMAVVAFQNGMEGLVGKIISVNASTSVVLPLFDKRFYAAARFSRTRSAGLVNGRGSFLDDLVMEYVPRPNASEIQIGDLVVTSGLDSIYPADLAIGRVKSIETDVVGTAVTIHLDPALDFSRLEYVFVIETQKIVDNSNGEVIKSEAKP